MMIGHRVLHTSRVPVQSCSAGYIFYTMHRQQCLRWLFLSSDLHKFKLIQLALYEALCEAKLVPNIGVCVSVRVMYELHVSLILLLFQYIIDICCPINKA